MGAEGPGPGAPAPPSPLHPAELRREAGPASVSCSLGADPGPGPQASCRPVVPCDLHFKTTVASPALMQTCWCQLPGFPVTAFPKTLLSPRLTSLPCLPETSVCVCVCVCVRERERERACVPTRISTDRCPGPAPTCAPGTPQRVLPGTGDPATSGRFWSQLCPVLAASPMVPRMWMRVVLSCGQCEGPGVTRQGCDHRLDEALFSFPAEPWSHL